MKKIIIIMLILCCVGCNVKKNIELSEKTFNDTIYGHKEKKDAMTVDEAYSLIYGVYGSLYDKIEYYDIIKFAPSEVSNDFYVFFSTKDDDSYYILVDIYNGVTTFVTVDDLNIKK